MCAVSAPSSSPSKHGSCFVFILIPQHTQVRDSGNHVCPIHHLLQLPSTVPVLRHTIVGRSKRRGRTWTGACQDGTDITVIGLYEDKGSQSFQSGLTTRTPSADVLHVTECQRNTRIQGADRAPHVAGSEGFGSLCLLSLQS